MEDMTGTEAMTGVEDMMTGVKGTTGAEKGAESTKESVRSEGGKGSCDSCRKNRDTPM
jgi:hypothetical protein